MICCDKNYLWALFKGFKGKGLNTQPIKKGIKIETQIIGLNVNKEI